MGKVAGVTGPLANERLDVLLQRVATADASPGAGPTIAWTCAMAAGLAEMVCAVELRKDPPASAGSAARRDRAAELRGRALELAEADVAAYSAVMAVVARRDEPGHGGRLREAMSHAAQPPLEIAETAAEVTRLAADCTAYARGGVRGEALTAAVLGETAVRAAAAVVEMNLAGARDDPRHAAVAGLAEGARADLARAQQPLRRAG
jgi:formiminotetrahydrofolate cyclodeaminase